MLEFTLLNSCMAQHKGGYFWVVGANASFGQFDGSTNRPAVGQLFNAASPDFPYVFLSAASNICDSATGKLLFFTNGMKLWDTAGNVMSNGDSLMPLKAFTQNNPPLLGQTQGSLILPKGSTGKYYVFIPTVSDSTYDWYWTGASGLPNAPFDMLYVNEVDMQANNGLGTVVSKNKKLLHDKELYKTGMQACRHANGYDWWLLKQGGYGKNEIIRFLVTKDSIYGPYIQIFADPEFSYKDLSGQISFSSDGKNLVSSFGTLNKMFLADFDRCSGLLSNPKVINIPIDSTTIPNPLPWYVMDSVVGGVAFSPNGQFIYVSKRFNIYQYEPGQPDSSLAWVRIKHGEDTTYAKFQYYHHLYPGPDGRMYIGNEGGTAKQFSVIDYPNLKGTACGFCRKCFRNESALGGLNAPPNMPNFNLGPDVSKPCWPLGLTEAEAVPPVVYPNPSDGLLWVEGDTDQPLRLLDLSGRDIKVADELISSRKHRLDLHQLPPGLYVLRVGNKAVMVKKE